MSKYVMRIFHQVSTSYTQKLDHKNKTLHLCNSAITILLKIRKTRPRKERKALF